MASDINKSLVGLKKVTTYVVEMIALVAREFQSLIVLGKKLYI